MYQEKIKKIIQKKRAQTINKKTNNKKEIFELWKQLLDTYYLLGDIIKIAEKRNLSIKDELKSTVLFKKLVDNSTNLEEIKQDIIRKESLLKKLIKNIVQKVNKIKENKYE